MSFFSLQKGLFPFSAQGMSGGSVQVIVECSDSNEVIIEEELVPLLPACQTKRILKEYTSIELSSVIEAIRSVVSFPLTAKMLELVEFLQISERDNDENGNSNGSRKTKATTTIGGGGENGDHDEEHVNNIEDFKWVDKYMQLPTKKKKGGGTVELMSAVKEGRLTALRILFVKCWKLFGKRKVESNLFRF